MRSFGLGGYSLTSPKIGVLALQGAFAKHRQLLKKMGVCSCEVRTKKELDACDGLIIPGGESTTLQIVGKDLLPAITTFEGAIFGTCAGAILMAKLDLLNMDVLRNGYGRQIASTETTVMLTINNGEQKIKAIFIRAPIITHVGPDVEILATYQNQPVVVSNGRYLATTFHPELTEETKIHELFLQRLLVKSR